MADYRLQKFLEEEAALDNASSIEEVFRIFGWDLPSKEELITAMGGTNPNFDLSSLSSGSFVQPPFQFYLFSGIYASGIYVEGDMFKLGVLHRNHLRYLEIAVLGFSMIDGLPEIQTIKPKSKFARLPFDLNETLPYHWDKELILVFESFLKSQGFEYARLRPACEHPNYLHPAGTHPGTPEYERHIRKMDIRYNGNAAHLRYKKRDNYIKKL
ncbi:MAG: hypothetical protein NDI94_05255 [Candidatus Woesearchaeota archaeon]|nr:hypothetical protein [Candidatus Woesearchaeota archaeon]